MTADLVAALGAAVERAREDRRTAAPKWEAVDSPTADLLTVLADDGRQCVDREWDAYRAALISVAMCNDGVIRPNLLRPLVRDEVAPPRIGAFANRALRSGLVEYTGEWEVSDDSHGGNAGKPCRVMRWIGTSP